jgi:[acyl-carrier-protein] S-malonyltransferase
MSGLGILCPGQGDQHESMFDILSNSDVAQKALRSAAPIFGDLPETCLGQLNTSQLYSNQYAQPLIGLLQLATWAALCDLLPTPKVFAGYSLGEVSSYGCAGALDLETTLALIDRRAALMDSVSPQPAGLLAIRGIDKQDVLEFCRATGLEIAIINNVDHYIVGGPDERLQRVEEHPLLRQATTVRRLQVTVPSHTSWLSGAGAMFSQELEASSLKNPPVPVLSGTSGALVRTRKDAITALTHQISQPINWMVCMQTVSEIGCTVLLELGPGNALSKMFQGNSSRVVVRSVADFRSLQGVSDWVHKHLG